VNLRSIRETLARFSLFFGKSKIRYRALQSFTKAEWYETDMNKYLASFAKSSLNAEEKKELQQNFCLRMSDQKHRDPLSLPGPFRDTSYTLALYKYDESLVEWQKYEHLACIGFDTDVLGNNMVVKQIQGNPGKGKLLRLLKWERMLMAILTDWARISGFGQIKIIQAKDNYWYPNRSSDIKKIMFMHYDVTARRSGFNFDPNKNQYVKILA
jgi:hypothetical protein